MLDLRDLAEAVLLKRDEIEEAANQLAINTVMVMVDDLVSHTPVDESTAMSNWIVRLNSPFNGVIPAHNLGSRGSTRTSSGDATIAAARAVLANKKPGQTIWISNNVPYIEQLNNGTSTQEPRGFFARAILKGRLFVQNHG